MGRFPLVHIFFTPTVNDAAAINDDSVFVANAQSFDQAQNGQTSGTSTRKNNLGLFKFSPCQVKRINQTGCCDNGRAVLIIMKHRNVEFITQPLLDNETFRRADIFQVYTPKCVPYSAYAFYKFLRILFFNFDIK